MQSGPVSRILFPGRVAVQPIDRRDGHDRIGQIATRPRRRSFLWAGGCPPARAPYPRRGTRRAASRRDRSKRRASQSRVSSRFDRPLARRLHGLAGGGVYPAAPVARRAVRSYRTFSPLPGLRPAVYFLWHFPWHRCRWPLAITVPCPVRTFLPWLPTGDRLARSATQLYQTPPAAAPGDLSGPAATLE